MRGLIFIVLVFFTSTGCIAVPGPESFKRFDRQFEKKPEGNVRRMLGEPGSVRPVRVGQTRAQLHAVLGTPYMLSADKSIESYGFDRHYGFAYSFVPLPHMWGDQTTYEPFYLVLRYDPEDRLSSWQFDARLVRSDFRRSNKGSRYKVDDTEMYYIDREKGWPTTQPW